MHLFISTHKLITRQVVEWKKIEFKETFNLELATISRINQHYYKATILLQKHFENKVLLLFEIINHILLQIILKIYHKSFIITLSSYALFHKN